VLVGRTNCDEFAMGSSNENSAFFPVSNPWDLQRVPGGSSGGSSAAVAARMVPLTLGTDTGGSIRQPAALCGVVGFKPTYGRVSRYGLIAFASSLDQIGPFTLTVEAALETLRSLGATLEEVSLPSTDAALSTYYVIAPAECSCNLARYDGIRYGLREDRGSLLQTYLRTRDAGFGPEVKRRIMLGTYALSSGYYDAYYRRAQRVRTVIAREFDAVFETVDALVCPTSPKVAFTTGAIQDPIEMYLNDALTIPVNLAGLPGISLPCGFSDDLPVGLQVIAPRLRDARVFQVAAAYEGATEWHTLRAPLVAA
jgi:aspartyl-tRNA(Asn)/glutamyl-tRNA(Gln) amidotransferase subunit A